jgi:hypothetical protein
MNRSIQAVTMLSALTLAACGDSPSESTPDDIDRMRAATEAYQNAQVAIDAGFVPLSECVASPDGGMGIHYGLPSRLEDAVVDASAPEVLLYAPDGAGGLRLVGVEFMVHQDAWAGAGNTTPPTIAGQTFDPPNPNHPDQMVRPFHTLHAWVWEENPLGMFTPFNPSVSCD